MNEDRKGGDSSLVRLLGVVKHYEPDRPVVDHVSFQVKKGEWLAVAGKSGSGKTTLINLIAGLDTPDQGEVIVGDAPIHRMDEKERALWRSRNVGFVFQFFHLLPTLTVLENVLLAMDLGGKLPVKSRSERARGILEQLGIVDLQKRFGQELSGGERQRAAIARALANDPPLLVADEPTGNLDSHTALAVFDIFRTLVEEGRTILMVTHDPEARARADRSIHLTDGRLVQEEDSLPRAQKAGGAVL